MSPNAVIMAMAEIMKPVVANIEAQPAATKDRYDLYMAAIHRFKDSIPGTSERTAVLVIAVAMTYAGANRNGVKAAMQAMGYLS